MMKRTQLKRRSTLKAKKPLRSAKVASKKRKSVKRPKTHKGYKTPPWFNKIAYGSHGSTPAQKRYWKVISDTYRKEDWEKYKKCVSCGKHIEDWKHGDLAHFKKYSVCNSWFKFERRNLALSCKGCNQRDDGLVGYHFGEELKRRHGDHIIEWIEKTNQAYQGIKIEDWEIVEKVEKLRPDMVY